ncbi:hypothetical protein CSKR_106838 [Clonorchis sinensis]|uniref:Uncharacterized protein n=1 Tax=Clonorchis sinensis TaxID=79923 RepID=A0A419PUG1_CLOSI|nr:hypothetical protein CSKR_106838 [Clonorchis sinensis]
MVKFQPTVQQVGMNVSWSQLGSIGEFVVFAVNGTSGRGHGREKEWNSCGSAIELGMAVPCHHWPDMLQFLDSPAGRGNKVERSRYGIAGFFWDPVVEHHRPGGVGNSQPGPPNQALPKFEAWEDEGATFRGTVNGRGTRATGGAAGIRTHHGATQQGRPPCRTYRPPHEVFIPRACYQICNVACYQAVMIAACALKKELQLLPVMPLF